MMRIIWRKKGGRPKIAPTCLPGTHTFGYFHDGDGNLDYHTRPDGSAVDYAYNLRNPLRDITEDTASPWPS